MPDSPPKIAYVTAGAAGMFSAGGAPKVSLLIDAKPAAELSVVVIKPPATAKILIGDGFDGL